MLGSKAGYGEFQQVHQHNAVYTQPAVKSVRIVTSFNVRTGAMLSAACTQALWGDIPRVDCELHLRPVTG